MANLQRKSKYGFTPKALQNLNNADKCKYYVYGLIDPTTEPFDDVNDVFGKPFYIGKGCGNRVFDHIIEAQKLYTKRELLTNKLGVTEEELENMNKELKKVVNDKIETIWQIFDNGEKPRCVIYRWGLTEQEAFEVEATLIDCMPNLVNIQSGHDSEHGMMSVEKLQMRLDAPIFDKPKTPEGKSIPYIIIKTRESTIAERGSLYEAVRGCWHAKLKKAKEYHYVLAVVRGVVKEVYEVSNWHTSKERRPRIEFDGEPTTNPAMRNLVGKLIPEEYRTQGLASPFLYSK